jgi:predicted PurR-regulated permease PerM
MPSEVHKLSFLHILASVVLVIGSLYWARAVFVPLALSLMLTFLLQPVVAMLHRWGLSYAPAAGLVVLLLALLIGAIGWVAVTQSATSGKAGGLNEVEPLKAVRGCEPLKAVRW